MLIVDDIYNDLVANNFEAAVWVDDTRVVLFGGEKETYLRDWVEIQYNSLFMALRAKRNALLKESDYTQNSDALVDSDSWAVYRQQLRDFPETINSFEELQRPTWPIPPV